MSPIQPDALREAAHLMIADPGEWYLLVTGDVAERHNIGTWAYRARRGWLVPLRDALAETEAVGYWEATVRTLPAEEGDGKAVKCYVRFVESNSPIPVDKRSPTENNEVVSQ